MKELSDPVKYPFLLFFQVGEHMSFQQAGADVVCISRLHKTMNQRYPKANFYEYIMEGLLTDTCTRGKWVTSV